MPGRMDAILDSYLAGDMPANVALMQLFTEAPGPNDVEAAIAARRGGGADRERLAALTDLARRHPDAWRRVRAVMAQANHAGTDPAGWAAVFDRLAASDPESGVALYGLGSPDLLAAATGEVAALLRGWGLTGAGKRLLEIGCGYGRLSLSLAGDFDEVLGLDVSPGMIADARRRAVAFPHLRFETTDGSGLPAVEAGSVDLVLAGDVFPYLVAAGPDVARRHIRDAARALRPGGALAILNYSYRGDDALDRAEVAAVFAEAGLAVERNGTRDLRLWDARAFLGRKPA